MKLEKSTIAGVILFIAVIVFIFWLFVYKATYNNDDCLNDYARSYCNQQNLTFYDVRINGGQKYIRCWHPDYNPRGYGSDELTIFKFLPEERYNCRVKFKERFFK